MALTRKWEDHSFFLELKPRSDMASLFMDFPNNGSEEHGTLDVGKDYIDYGDPIEDSENVAPSEPAIKPGGLRTNFEGIELAPGTLSCGTWTKNERLFMCKIKAFAHPPLTYKPNHRLAQEASSVEPLKKFVEENHERHIGLACCECGANLLAGPENEGRKLSVGWVPSDEWMNTTPAVDYYCRDTCGAACDPHKHGHHRTGIESEGMHDDWKPTKLRVMISHTTLFVRKEIMKDNIKIDNNLVSCLKCNTLLGQRVKGNNKNILQFHHSLVALCCDRERYLNIRYPDRTFWYSQQLLIHFEEAASQKLVIRTLEKKPMVFVWILDSFVSILTGRLTQQKEDAERSRDSDNRKFEFTTSDVVRPILALKLLYKIFDQETAASDPRANGEDSSVGLVDLPPLACDDLKEALLCSSLAIPVTLRTLGQFFVAYLPLP